MPTGKEILDIFSNFYPQYGYLIIFLVLLLDNLVVVGLLFPAEILIIMGGYFARQGNFSIILMLFVGYIGMTIGQSIAFIIGSKGLQHFLIKWGFENQLQIANNFFNKYGMMAVLYASFMGSTRTMLSVAIGSSDVPYRKFLIWESLSAIIWGCTFALLGYFLGYNQPLIEWVVGNIGYYIPIIILATIITVRYKRKKNNRQYTQ